MRPGNYEDYKKYLYSEGLTNKLINIDQTNNIDKICKIFEIRDIEKDRYSYIVDINFLNLITINKNYVISLHIIDNDNKEIPDDTKIQIQKIVPSANIVDLANIKYSDIKINNINNGYKFDTHIQIYPQYHLMIGIINYNVDIPKENIKFNMTFDYWTKK